jgi:organic radical activating enzyme
MDSESRSFCSLMWRHLCLKSDSRISPCCRFEDHTDLPQVNEKFDDLDQIVNAPQFIKNRQISLNGESIKGCQKCYRHEAAGIFSLRNVANLKFPPKKDMNSRAKLSEIESLELFVGSLCNLKCLYCGPSLSSTWQAEAKKLGWKHSSPAQAATDYQRLLVQLPNLREIKFLGGEPLLSKKHRQVLEIISPDLAKNIELIYYTNATVEADKFLREKWKSFKKVTLWMSIDGYQEVNSYIRFPSQWSVVEQNAKSFFSYSESHHDFSLNIHCTVSAYNLFSLKQLSDWFDALKGSFRTGRNSILYFSPLSQPDIFSPSVLPAFYRNQAVLGLDLKNKWQAQVAGYLKAFEYNKKLPEFIERTRLIDRMRGQSVGRSIPELAPLFG